MAGKGIKRSRLRASSVLEVIVAMVVILTVFGIALAIFNNVVRWSLPYRKIKAELLLRDIQQSTVLIDNETKTVTVDGLVIRQTISPYPADPGLSIFTLTASVNDQQPIAEVRQLIVTPQ